nr:hypothetical protein [uncultured Draconibacterium sp.]
MHQSVTNGISGGILGFEIYDFDIMVNPLASTTPNYTEIKTSVIDIRIKDIKLSIVDSNGDTISDVDIEYISKLDKTFKDEGDTISLTTGTERLYIDRGKIMKLENSSYSAVTE